MALVNSFGALGGFVGAYVVGYMVGTPGGTAHAFIFMAVALALAGILMLPTSRVRSKLTAQPGTGARPLHSHTKVG